MAVLVEANSTIVRRDRIDDHFDGGWEMFKRLVPNGTMCTDGELVRVGFMDYRDQADWVISLERRGLFFSGDDEDSDITLVDQLKGHLLNVNWIEVGKLPIGPNQIVSACWLYEGERRHNGMHFHVRGNSLSINVVVPPGWDFETSLTNDFTFIPKEDGNSPKIRLLRREGDEEVYLDTQTGREHRIFRNDI